MPSILGLWWILVSLNEFCIKGKKKPLFASEILFTKCVKSRKGISVYLSTYWNTYSVNLTCNVYISINVLDPDCYTNDINCCILCICKSLISKKAMQLTFRIDCDYTYLWCTYHNYDTHFFILFWLFDKFQGYLTFNW